MCKGIEEGGLKLMILEDKIKALKIGWITRLHQEVQWNVPANILSFKHIQITILKKTKNLS